MEGVVSKKKARVDCESSPEQHSVCHLGFSESMPDQPKSLALPFDEGPVVRYKYNTFGPHLLFSMSRLTGCYHFDLKGRCRILYVVYSFVFNLLLTAAYVYTFNPCVRTMSSETSGSPKLIEFAIGFVIVGGNGFFSIVSSIVLYVYKDRFPLVMKNVGDFKLHTINKIISVVLTVTYSVIWIQRGGNLIEIPFDLAILQHLLYMSQYVVLTNRWNRYLMTMTSVVSRFDEKMMEGHAKIIRAHKALNDIYGPPILFNVVMAFTITVENLFKFYSGLKAQRFNPKTIPPIVFYCVLIFWVAAASDFTTKLAENFTQELFKVMNQNAKLRSNSTLRLYLLKKYSLEFTACGFFSVGYPFITSLIAAAVTYLVVLIQFTE